MICKKKYYFSCVSFVPSIYIKYIFITLAASYKDKAFRWLL